MSEEKKDIKLDDELQKALEDLFSKEELEEIVKGKEKKKSEDYDDEQGDVPGEQDTGPDEYDDKDKDEDEDMEKAYNKMKAEYDEMEKACMSKKSELEKMQKKMKGMSKSEEEDIKKSFSDILDEKLSASKTENEELKKSISTLVENQNKMSEIIEKMASAPYGTKGYKNLNVLEKSIEGGEGEEESKYLSLSKNKEDIEKAIEDIVETGNLSEDKKQEYYLQLANYNSGGSPLSKGLLSDIQKSTGAVIVK